MRCVFTGCKAPPHMDAQWGSVGDDAQQATLCRPHADELWGRLNPLVQTGRCWFRCDVPGGITRKSVDNSPPTKKS